MLPVARFRPAEDSLLMRLASQSDRVVGDAALEVMAAYREVTVHPQPPLVLQSWVSMVLSEKTGLQHRNAKFVTSLIMLADNPVLQRKLGLNPASMSRAEHDMLHAHGGVHSHIVSVCILMVNNIGAPDREGHRYVHDLADAAEILVVALQCNHLSGCPSVPLPPVES